MNSAAVPGIDAGRRRRQLPVEVSAFVGRADELGALGRLLRDARHVTVTGPGGVGKTRLALRAAADAADRYPDGSCLVELSELPGPAGTDARAARDGRRPRPRAARARSARRARRRPRPPARPAAAADPRHLRAPRRPPARGSRPSCCATAGEVALLTTSRQPLRVPGERVLRIGPLPVPGPGRDPAPGDAVELFAKRAAAALPGFAVTDADRPDVIRLCRRLDGIPLALELAAVRVRALPLAELAERLESRFSVLTGARRGSRAPPPDAASLDRVVLRPVHRGRADGVGPALGLRRALRPRRRAGGGGLPAGPRRPCRRRPRPAGGQVGRCPGRGNPVPAARLGARVRGGAAGRGPAGKRSAGDGTPGGT